VCWRRKEGGNDGEVELLAITYSVDRPNAPLWTTWRFPSETGEKGESPLDTAGRCLREEVADNPGCFNFRFLNDEGPIATEVVPGDFRGTHNKCVFIAEITFGNLRTRDKLEPKKKGRPKEILGPPTWLEVREVMQRMRVSGICFHIGALLKALSFLAGQNRYVAQHYSDLLS